MRTTTVRCLALGLSVGGVCFSKAGHEADKIPSLAPAECEPLSGSLSDSVIRDSVLVLVAQHATKGPSIAIVGSAWIVPEGFSKDTLAVVFVWPKEITDANVTGLVLKGSLCFGGIRSLNILLLGDHYDRLGALERSFFDAPLKEWNSAFSRLHSQNIVADADGALVFADLFLNFAVGEVPTVLPDSTRGPRVSLSHQPGLTQEVTHLSGTQVVNQDGFWRVSGVVNLRGTHHFTIDIERSGAVRQWSTVSNEVKNY